MGRDWGRARTPPQTRLGQLKPGPDPENDIQDPPHAGQAAHDKSKSSEQNDLTSADGSSYLPENLESISSKMNGLSLSGSASLVTPPSDSTECSAPVDQVQDIDKKIRALKKKIRLTEAQQQKGAEKDLKPEQLEKVAKLEGWRNELKLLEEKKAELAASLS
ncbi:UNVERIFIED_CONTAM: Partner of Y14 and mago [Sesamum radiatum]|uniref:Partner of Y14 and mago n=1 Tax=Sesamum radiatum TaxID=300843 RepID=A0AAW2MUH1_SESRA